MLGQFLLRPPPQAAQPFEIMRERLAITLTALLHLLGIRRVAVDARKIPRNTDRLSFTLKADQDDVRIRQLNPI